jgi:uncharacterized protein (DUF983 family)
VPRDLEIGGQSDYPAPMAETGEHRDLRTAVLRGWRLRCPSCGEGHLMGGYLDVAPVCQVCGTELFHHRADDGPAWSTILITGHLMAPLMLIVFEMFRPEGWKMALGFSVVFVALSLWMLPRLKGVFVGLQWAKRMHGFASAGNLARSA